MAIVGPPFGGNTARVNLAPMAHPPARGYRVIPGLVWWNLVYLHWRNYRAAHMVAMPATPPPLAPPGQGVYFTDHDSLQGLHTPGEFAIRLGLPRSTHTECHFYGIAVIEFEVLSSMHVLLPPPAPGCKQGLTPGEAREWRTTDNISLSQEMSVTYIDPTSRYFPIFL